MKDYDKYRKLCHMPGCKTMTHATRGYCGEHYRTAFACRLEGCEKRVSSASHYGFCAEHRRIGPKTKPVP